jgi:glycosyltransferase involved in cell wall biosynthesis
MRSLSNSRSRIAPITALITVHNGAAFVADAIRSVQNQTLSVAEILLVDDGSTDGSDELARSLGVKVISQENQGAAAARNAGIQAASQEWIAFLDHDDVWEPKKIELQWQAHQLCPDAGLVFTDYCEIDDGAIEPRVVSVFSLPGSGFDRLQRNFVAADISHRPTMDDEVFETIKKNVFLPSTTLVKRDLVISAGLFQEDLFPVDDIDCFLRCFAKTSVAFVERPLMRYRSHSSNTTKNELRMLLVFFKFTNRMAAVPDVYPAGAIAVLTAPKALSLKYFEAARLLIDAGDTSEARRLLRESFRLRKCFRPVILWVLTWVTPKTYRFLLRAKRSLNVPVGARARA